MAKIPTFRSVRWVRTLNLLAQAVLFVTLFAGLNYLAVNYAWRFDLTENRSHSLSPETTAYLKNLSQPVRIIVTLTETSDNADVTQAYRDVSGLLREYVYTTAGNERGKISVEFLDVYQRRRDAEALGIEQPNTIVVLVGNKPRIIQLDELYQVENNEKKAFRGEQIFTSAILELSSPTQKKIYFLTGHGEMSLDDVSAERGLSGLEAELKARNFAVEPIDLAQSRKIPDDAAVIVIAGPQGRFDAIEEELLRQYLSNRAGRVLALLAPGYPTGLDNLLFDWGVLVDDVLIYDRSASGQTETGDLILPALDEKHALTRSLLSYKIPLRFGLSRSVRPDPGRTLDPNLVVTPLVATTEQAWGERNYRERVTPSYDVGVDLPGRVIVVTASERLPSRKILNTPDFSVPSGRLVAYGSADWIANGRLGVIGNLSFFLSAVNWATDRDIDFKVPARPIAKFQLSLSEEQLQRLRYSLIFALPGLAAVIGLIVYWTRRN
ncbi:GldG family protein [Rariglobus hedericola]|uniref:ABC transporter n=1 Tax=Rariglobus hedericola TaxID=2597822 RepID=A0A556QR32_9BACT|nr:GldG family protein [Rariglobus hedericola]TSJ79097.1 ABC transporter [Rariglobus hedericola]